MMYIYVPRALTWNIDGHLKNTFSKCCRTHRAKFGMYIKNNLFEQFINFFILVKYHAANCNDTSTKNFHCLLFVRLYSTFWMMFYKIMNVPNSFLMENYIIITTNFDVHFFSFFSPIKYFFKRCFLSTS